MTFGPPCTMHNKPPTTSHYLSVLSLKPASFLRNAKTFSRPFPEPQHPRDDRQRGPVPQAPPGHGRPHLRGEEVPAGRGEGGRGQREEVSAL